MSRTPLKFRQRDVERAIRAAQSAGLKIESVRIESTGAIEIVTGKPPEQDRQREPIEANGSKHIAI
jgi:hypothetical protein